ncbi:MAG: hypothetical protein ACP5HK_00725, partial [Acidilobus sp.]
MEGETLKSLSAGTLAAIVVVIVALAAAGAYYYYSTMGGNVYLYITDPGHSVGQPGSAGNNSFLAIYLTINSIMIHSATKGWITVSNSTRTVKLSSSLS